MNQSAQRKSELRADRASGTKPDPRARCRCDQAASRWAEPGAACFCCAALLQLPFCAAAAKDGASSRRFACFASISCHSCSLFTSFLSFCWCASCSCLLRLRLRLVFMPGASPDWMAGGGGAVQTSANNGDGGFVELRALCCCSNGAHSQALGMLASPSTSRAASSPCEMADLPIVAL